MLTGQKNKTKWNKTLLFKQMIIIWINSISLLSCPENWIVGEGKGFRKLHLIVLGKRSVNSFPCSGHLSVVNFSKTWQLYPRLRKCLSRGLMRSRCSTLPLSVVPSLHGQALDHNAAVRFREIDPIPCW